MIRLSQNYATALNRIDVSAKEPKLKALICKCCGAPISRETMRCEYCGTEYSMENGIPVMRVETFRPNVETHCAGFLIDRYQLEQERRTGRAVDFIEFAIHRLAEAMLPEIEKNMQIKVQERPERMGVELIGAVKTIVPQENNTEWMKKL